MRTSNKCCVPGALPAKSESTVNQGCVPVPVAVLSVARSLERIGIVGNHRANLITAGGLHGYELDLRFLDRRTVDGDLSMNLDAARTAAAIRHPAAEVCFNFCQTFYSMFYELNASLCGSRYGWGIACEPASRVTQPITSSTPLPCHWSHPAVQYSSGLFFAHCM